MHDSYNFSREILRKFPGLSTLDSPHLGITATHTRIYEAHLQGTARAKGIPAGSEVIRREKCKASPFSGDGERCHLGLDVCMYGCLYCTSEWHHPIPLWNPLPHVTAVLIASILREWGLRERPPTPHVLGKWHEISDEMGAGTGAEGRVQSSPSVSRWRIRPVAVAYLSTRWHSALSFIFVSIPGKLKGHKTFACFPSRVLVSCTVMLCLLYNYNLFFPLGPWQRSL